MILQIEVAGNETIGIESWPPVCLLRSGVPRPHLAPISFLSPVPRGLDDACLEELGRATPLSSPSINSNFWVPELRSGQTRLFNLS